MPNKKRQQHNAFYFFMKEKQAAYSAKGQQYSMKEMSEVAHPDWKKLSVNEKQRYEDMARTHKIQYNAVGRLACDGTSILENMQQELRREEIEKQMRQGIVDLLRIPGLSSKEEFILINSQKKFYFVTFNILCFVEGGMYIPNEVGAAEYSIKDGITGRYHKFINPGPIPKGYTGEAKRHSEDTHQIPIFGHNDSEKNYKMIWKELMDFINPPLNQGSEPPPMFCLKDDMYQTLGSAEWLATQAGAEEDIQYLKVWDASYLLMELRIGLECAAASYVVAADNLKKNNFDYIPNTRCHFHEDLDSAHCALGYANRLCYLLSDSVCGLFNVEVTEKHLPLRAMTEKPYEVHIPSFQNITLHSSNERGIGRGLPKVQNSMSSRPESSVRGRTNSSLSLRTDSRLTERTEPNRYTGSNSIYFSCDESKSGGVESDSENSPPGSLKNVCRVPAATSRMSSNAQLPDVQLRQPSTTSIALTLARAAQASPVVPGQGIGRGQRKLP